MLAKVCYLGDGRLDGAAAYLAAIMQHYGIPFDHVPSHEGPPDSFCRTPYALYVVSDYPAGRFGRPAMEFVAQSVAAGSGLVMLGGWESFFGRVGEYHLSPLADCLPVLMGLSDDRRNHAQPCLLAKVAEHPILEGLPWDTPPGIGGRNAFAPKPGAATLLEAVEFNVRRREGEYEFRRANTSPLLVVGQHGRGRAAALATDVAPHWVGGFVDWGERRIVETVAGDIVEIGNWYAAFFRNLLCWAMAAGQLG